MAENHPRSKIGMAGVLTFERRETGPIITIDVATQNYSVHIHGIARYLLKSGDCQASKKQ